MLTSTGKSTYVPRWVKTNPERFPRAMLRTQRGRKITEVLSIFHDEIVQADARAFRKLMQHIKEIDEEHATIIMVQVENEVGLLGDSRDGSLDADKQFARPVPQDLIEMLNRDRNQLHPSLIKNLGPFAGESGLSWFETFGDAPSTDELFMAYHYARYVNSVACAGREEYPLPLFTNVWQNYVDEDADTSQPVVVGGGGLPGDYPSGGGVVSVLDIWHHFAPSLDFIAPDLYLNDYNAVCAKYRHRGQPLFIPEQRRDAYGARRIWSAYGTYHALCASPFAIDTLPLSDTVWTTHFGLLKQVSEYILAARETGRVTLGFFFDEFNGDAEVLVRTIGTWRLSIERAFVFGAPSPGYGMIIQLTEARFLLVGEGYQVTFDNESGFTGILSFTEKMSNGLGGLKDGRTLNGDETRSGQCAIMPSESPDYGEFPICITVPARSRIAEVEVYAIPSE